VKINPNGKQQIVYRVTTLLFCILHVVMMVPVLIFSASLPKQYRYVSTFKHIILVADQSVCALSFGGKVVNINVLEVANR
jgi:hypothetical protein